MQLPLRTRFFFEKLMVARKGAKRTSLTMKPAYTGSIHTLRATWWSVESLYDNLLLINS
jgi:hypothetical protein